MLSVVERGRDVLVYGFEGRRAVLKHARHFARLQHRHAFGARARAQVCVELTLLVLIQLLMAESVD